MGWLALVLGLAGVAAYLLQEVRRRSLLVKLAEREAHVQFLQGQLDAANRECDKLADALQVRNEELNALWEVCSENDDPAAVRARLRLLLDPTGTAGAPGPLPDGPSADSGGAGGGGGGGRVPGPVGGVPRPGEPEGPGALPLRDPAVVGRGVGAL